jgi:hypothetical protein
LYEVNALNNKHEIWKRDSLGIELYSTEVAKQKPDYIHFNPVSGKWQLLFPATSPARKVV